VGKLRRLRAPPASPTASLSRHTKPTATNTVDQLDSCRFNLSVLDPSVHRPPSLNRSCQLDPGSLLLPYGFPEALTRRGSNPFTIVHPTVSASTTPATRGPNPPAAHRGDAVRARADRLLVGQATKTDGRTQACAGAMAGTGFLWVLFLRRSTGRASSTRPSRELPLRNESPYRFTVATGNSSDPLVYFSLGWPSVFPSSTTLACPLGRLRPWQPLAAG